MRKILLILISVYGFASFSDDNSKTEAGELPYTPCVKNESPCKEYVSRGVLVDSQKPNEEKDNKSEESPGQN